jgi:hypothetical protein
MPSACEKATQYHGRDNSISSKCREHNECIRCQVEIQQNMSSMYEQVHNPHPDQHDIYMSYGVEYKNVPTGSKHAECEAFCENFNKRDKDICMGTCLTDGNTVGAYIEQAGRNDDEVWTIYKQQIRHASRQILSNMKKANNRSRRMTLSKIEQIAGLY